MVSEVVQCALGEISPVVMFVLCVVCNSFCISSGLIFLRSNRIMAIELRMKFGIL